MYIPHKAQTLTGSCVLFPVHSLPSAAINDDDDMMSDDPITVDHCAVNH